jgi:thiol-disulfide isomerase/thioredoxin
MEGVIVLAVVLAGATVFGLWRRRVDGRLAGQIDTERLTPGELGHELGSRATFVQFSTAFCQPCRANRQVLSHLAGTSEGVAHVDVDAESHLDLVRRMGVTRTPTTFLLDSGGVVRHRATGPVRLADARATLAEFSE